MSNELFTGFAEMGWDHAPWESEPVFSANELRVILNSALPAAEVAEQIGCVEHDVLRLRRAAYEKRSQQQ
ncbi:hypothetical protein [Mycolicibacterium sp. HS_4_1]